MSGLSRSCTIQSAGSPSFGPGTTHTAAPLVIQCLVTLRCGLTCPHCLATHPAARIADMELPLFQKVCRESAALGVREILVTGGEPLIRRDIGDLVDTLDDHDLFWSLNTACCPTPAQQRALLRHPPGFVAVSLDGPAAVHDAFRGRQGSQKDALSALRFFSEIPDTVVCAGTTLTTTNLPHLEETYAIVRASGAHRWGIHLLLPEGRAAERGDLFPSMRAMRTVLAFIAAKRAEFPVTLCDEMGHAGDWEPLVRDTPFICAAGRAMCAILPDGSVMPCSTLDPRHCEGNVATEPLELIWRERFVRQRA